MQDFSQFVGKKLWNVTISWRLPGTDSVVYTDTYGPYPNKFLAYAVGWFWALSLPALHGHPEVEEICLPL